MCTEAHSYDMLCTGVCADVTSINVSQVTKDLKVNHMTDDQSKDKLSTMRLRYIYHLPPV